MIDLSKFGESYHDQVGYENTTKFLHLFTKSGAVRATLSGPGFKLPLYDYDTAAYLPAEKLGDGVRQFTKEQAHTVVQAELDNLTQALANKSGNIHSGHFLICQMGMYVYNTGTQTAEEIKERILADTESKDYRPYHWYRFDTLDWLILAHHGIAVEYLPNRQWKWCTPARALELATVPLHLSDYETGLRTILTQLTEPL